ncbi:uncharacterized protein N7483_000834 [Penicillium malachiteum]|uniref:uncharacterized protein n=1 Tax=Penicillium malachiteum TaxID=1324776 RepID=UPI002546F5BE|nr:uncharacterized protein N7483_000834 [Penicillium malachiteum]KAJ5735709.1 hypothetical protein N7483_000834 [Penicillium malachiteum]
MEPQSHENENENEFKFEFDLFIDICGRSIFTEEYKGDLDAAWGYLQRAQSDAHPDLNTQAEHLRSSAIYSILTGNFADAFKHLESLHALLDQLSPEWGLRYTNYHVLANYTRRFPPALRFYHEQGSPLNVPMRGDIIGPYEISERFMANVNKYMPIGVPRDQGLSQVLNIIQWFSFNARHLTMLFHKLSPGGTSYKPGESATPTITERAKNFIRFRAVAEANGATNIAAYLTRLVVEFYIACDSPETGIMLDDYYQRCEKMGDKAGMANAKLMEADSLLCPPFTSPIMLNLIVFDGASATGDHNFWDPIEFDLRLDYSNEVQKCYESALDLFRAAGCKRGQAATVFRQGCCLHILGRLRRSLNEPYLELLIEAESKLQEALELFGRDEGNAYLVKAHQILLSISKGNPQRVKKLARDIGEWCAKAKNEQLAHVIGVLMCRFGNREWSQYSNLDTSRQAWECAYEIFKPVGDMIPLFQTVVSRAAVQRDIFNKDPALMLIEEASSMMDEVRGYIRDKIQSAPRTPLGDQDRTILQTNKCNLLWTFSRQIGRIYALAEDTESFLGWHTRMSDWLENDEDFRDWRERIEDPTNYPTEVYKSDITMPKVSDSKDLWRRVLADDAVNVKWTAADAGFRRLIDEGDILGAEEIMRRFSSDNEHGEKVYTRDLYRILACSRIGDKSKAREILDSISDDELFGGNLEAYQEGIAIRSFLPTVGQNALTFSIITGDLERGRRLVELIAKMSPTFFDAVTDNALDYAIRIGHHATIMMESEPEVAFSKLLTSKQIVETRRKQTADPDARVWSVTPGSTGEVYLNLARICLCAEESKLPLQLLKGHNHGNPEGISWAEHALLFVEMSRARAVLESLQTQTSKGLGLPDGRKTTQLSAAVHKRRLLRTLLSLKTLTADQENEISQLQQDIKVLEEDGTLSSATTFIETASSTIEPRLLYQSIDDDSVVIEATFGTQGSIAFVLTNDGIQHVHQSSKCSADIRRPVMRAIQILGEMDGYLGEEEEARKKLLNELCSEISQMLLVPFAEIIRSKSHIIFSISDPLTAFPFSILSFDEKPLVMHAVVSQVPSLTVLYYLSQRKSASASPTVSVLAKSPSEEPSGLTRSENESNLHMAGIEAVNIARTFETWPIEASQMTRKDFQRYVEGGSLIMHIGTHGDINPRNPLLSSISIGQGQEFRVLDMSAIQSNVNLLVFAACLSGFGKATIGSEVLGFSHVVLSTGCQAYVGSLWKVSDFASMLIMTLFYRHLKANPHRTVATAMRAAQMDLLQLDPDKAGILIDQMVENWNSPGSSGLSPAEFVPDAEFVLLTLKLILVQLDWTSPFFWAPFTLVGYGGFRFLHEAAEQ